MTIRTLAALLLTGSVLVLPMRAAEKDLDPAAQKLAQLEALKNTEATARRVATSIRVLQFQKLSAAEEKKTLTEVGNQLQSLGKDQMTAVLAHLESAVKAPDKDTATAEQRAAYDKHRQIVVSLRGMMQKLDTLKSLDQAAEKLDKLAKDQLELHLKAMNLKSLQDSGSRSAVRRVVEDRSEQADAQTDLRGEMTGFLNQTATLRGKLTPEQKGVLDAADVSSRSGRIIAEMEMAKVSLMNADNAGAASRQLTTAKELQAMAAALRPAKDTLAQLKESRDKVDKLIAAEKELKAQTEDAKKFDRTQNEPQRRQGTDPVKENANKLADQQAKIEFDTRDVRKQLEKAAPEVSRKLQEPEQQMHQAHDELRNNQNQKAAVEAEGRAEKQLAEARKELDKLIAKAEAEKTDPLTATKKALEEVTKLLQEQKNAKQATKQNENNKDALKQPAEAQKAVAKKADEVKNLPLPDKQDVKDALAKAAEATKAAAEQLANNDAKAAQPKQDDAIKALENAKKALEEKAAEIQKRQDEIAKLDEAVKKLDALAKEEMKVADAAQKAADETAQDNPKPSEVAKAQEKLQQPTKDAAKEIRALDEKAAEKVADAAISEEHAKGNLDKNEAKPAADDAKQAAEQLKEASKDLQAKANGLKAKEAADQQSLQPDKTDAAQAAEQLAKAIDEANKASDEAKKAAEQLGQQPMTDAKADLAKLQKDVAKKAEQLLNRDAAKDADDAAKALEKGDIPAALEKQQAALDKLGEAAKGEPAPAEGDAKPGDGEPKPADAKSNGELAKDQQKLKDATAALQQSQQANQAAQAALQQAQAQAPGNVKDQLQQAQKQLQQADQQLKDGQPSQAGQQQQQAADGLKQALDTLQKAAQQQGQQPGQQPGQGDKPDGQPGEGKDPGKQPGQGSKPGSQPGQKPGPGEEKNEGQNATGDRTDDLKNNKAASAGVKKDGDGNFIKLQAKDRDKVTTAVEAALPAEFRELIKQYNVNIKKAEKK